MINNSTYHDEGCFLAFTWTSKTTHYLKYNIVIFSYLKVTLNLHDFIMNVGMMICIKWKHDQKKIRFLTYNYQLEWSFRYKLLCVENHHALTLTLLILWSLFLEFFSFKNDKFDQILYIFLALFILKFIRAISVEVKYKTVGIILAIKV